MGSYFNPILKSYYCTITFRNPNGPSFSILCKMTFLWLELSLKTFSLQECRYPGTKLTLPIFYSGKNGNGKKKDYENENPSWNNRCDVTELFDGFFWRAYYLNNGVNLFLKSQLNIFLDLQFNNRAVVDFSNPGMPILLDCLFLLLSSFLYLQILVPPASNYIYLSRQVKLFVSHQLLSPQFLN